MNTIPSPPAHRVKGKKPESQTFTDFSTAVDINLASIDLDAENPQLVHVEAEEKDDANHGTNLTKYFYRAQTFLDDFKEDVYDQRKEYLSKYCIWKMKKWATKYKK